MVALNCPNFRMGNTETPPSWNSFTPYRRDLSNDMNSVSPFLIHKRSLILLNASMDHQGNYSCVVGNHTFWSKLIVYSAVSDENQKMMHYPSTCYAQKSCTLHCPSSNSPRSTHPNMTRLGITWKKDGKPLFKDGSFFSSVKETDQGAFTCTRSYLYEGQMYNMTFTIALTVKPQEPLQNVEIISPHDRDVFDVDLGAVFVVNCTATISSEFDDVFWIIDELPVNSDPNSRVFSNYTSVTNAKESHITASLIFEKIWKEDLSKNFICKLESVSVPSSFVTVSLKQKKQEHSAFPTVIIVPIILVAAVTALICVKCKVDICLCLCDGFCPKSVGRQTNVHTHIPVLLS